MKERFSFTLRVQVPLHVRALIVHVQVDGAQVTLSDDDERRFARGVWDTGRYVRYPRSGQLCVHPLVMDAVDAELRLLMTHQGEQIRAPELRRSAIGYSDS